MESKMKVFVDTQELDETLEKVRELHKLLTEAKSLAGEIASVTVELDLHI